MSEENRNSGSGWGIIIIIVIVIFACRHCSSDKDTKVSKSAKEGVEQSVNNNDDADNYDEDDADDYDDNGIKYPSDKKGGISQEVYKKKFLEEVHQFYDLYVDELGNDFEPDDEYDADGNYLGTNEEVCLQLGDLLKDMCENYGNVSKQNDREELLDEMFDYGSDEYESGYEIHRYITNIGQMVMIITGETWYNHELFVYEMNEAIIG